MSLWRRLFYPAELRTRIDSFIDMDMNESYFHIGCYAHVPSNHVYLSIVTVQYTGILIRVMVT